MVEMNERAKKIIEDLNSTFCSAYSSPYSKLQAFLLEPLYVLVLAAFGRNWTSQALNDLRISAGRWVCIRNEHTA